MCNFILQVFEDLHHMIRNSLNISRKQKMSKKEQNRKIAAVRKQISDLKSSHKIRILSMYSLGRSRPVQTGKKSQNKSEKNEENNYSNEKEEEECCATTTSTGAADTFGFFSVMMGFFHSSTTSVPAWVAS